MKRREFLKSAGVGLAASTAIAAPAIAQSMPEIKWRMPTSWPKSLDTLYGGCEHFARRVAEMSDNECTYKATRDVKKIAKEKGITPKIVTGFKGQKLRPVFSVVPSPERTSSDDRQKSGKHVEKDDEGMMPDMMLKYDDKHLSRRLMK